MGDAFAGEGAGGLVVDLHGHGVAGDGDVQGVPVSRFEVELEGLGLGFEQCGELGGLVTGLAAFTDLVVHAAGLRIHDGESFVGHAGHAQVTGVHGFELAIDEIDAEVVALAELEAQLDDAVLKLDVVEDGHAVISLGMFGDVHNAIDEIDLLMPFGPPAAVAGPAIADVLLAGRFFVAGKVIGEEQRGLSSHQMAAKDRTERKEGLFHGLR